MSEEEWSEAVKLALDRAELAREKYTEQAEIFQRKIRQILSAHAAVRKCVEEASDKLASLMPQLMVMLHDDGYIMRTVREIDEALKLSLDNP